MAEVHLVRDVLDQQVVDTEKGNVGKVDGVVIEINDDGSARVLYLDLGTAVLARRLSTRLADFYERLRHRFVRNPAPPFRISWKKVRHIDVAVHVDIDTAERDAYRLERWLRDHFIGRIPGATRKKSSKS